MSAFVAHKGRRWYPVASVPDGKGGLKRKWHSGYGTRAQAKAALSDIISTMNKGTYVQNSKLTLGKYLAEWLEARASQVRPSTLDSYRSNIEKHVLPQLGHVPLQRLSATDLDRLYATLLTRLSPRTVRYNHTIIRKALADAVRKGRVVRNVADLADPPASRTTKAPPMKTWTAEELRRFLEAIASDRLYPAYLLAATTGMRRGEVVGLQWRDVDLDSGRIAVRRTLIAVHHVVSESDPKTDRGRRSVALDPTTVAALRSWRKRQAEERLAWGPAYHDTGLVFTKEDGSLVHPDRFSKLFDRHVKRIGLPLIRLHDLRHTHASLMLQKGVHPKVVSERLGHATVSITLDTYSHVIPALQEDAAARVAEAIFGDR